jgi:predicted GNAT superfamily acetyltransferase
MYCYQVGDGRKMENIVTFCNNNNMDCSQVVWWKKKMENTFFENRCMLIN